MRNCPMSWHQSHLVMWSRNILLNNRRIKINLMPRSYLVELIMMIMMMMMMMMMMITTTTIMITTYRKSPPPGTHTQWVQNIIRGITIAMSFLTFHVYNSHRRARAQIVKNLPHSYKVDHYRTLNQGGDRLSTCTLQSLEDHQASKNSKK